MDRPAIPLTRRGPVLPNKPLNSIIVAYNNTNHSSSHNIKTNVSNINTREITAHNTRTLSTARVRGLPVVPTWRSLQLTRVKARRNTERQGGRRLQRLNHAGPTLSLPSHQPQHANSTNSRWVVMPRPVAVVTTMCCASDLPTTPLLQRQLRPTPSTTPIQRAPPLWLSLMPNLPRLQRRSAQLQCRKFRLDFPPVKRLSLLSLATPIPTA